MCLGCTLREAKVDPQAVQSGAELFETLTTTREGDEKDQTKEDIRWKRSVLGVMKWKIMPKNAVERYCESAKKRCVANTSG